MNPTQHNATQSLVHSGHFEFLAPSFLLMCLAAQVITSALLAL